MGLTPEPFPKKFYLECKLLGVTQVHVNWSGGSDNGYCSVYLERPAGAVTLHYSNPEDEQAALSRLEREIEDWAYGAFSYSGAGDGTDYGDELTYYLTTGKVTIVEWFMERNEHAPVEFPIVLDNEEEVAKEEAAVDRLDQELNGGVREIVVSTDSEEEE